MCTQTAHTSIFDYMAILTFFFEFLKMSVCATCVHIHCLTIHFLVVHIWYFNATKYQKRTLLQSSKVGGSRKSSFLALFRILIQKYGYFRNFQKSRDVTIRYIKLKQSYRASKNFFRLLKGRMKQKWEDKKWIPILFHRSPENDIGMYFTLNCVT